MSNTANLVLESVSTQDFAEGSITFTKPTGVAVDDFLLWIVACNDGDTISTPSGWTAFGSAAPLISGTDDNVDAYVFSKIADSGDVSASNYTIDVADGTGELGGIMIRFSGTPSSSVLEGLSQDFTNSSTTHSFTATTTPSNADSILIMVGSGAGTSTISSFTSTGSPTWTQRFYDTTSLSDHMVVATALYESTTPITSFGFSTSSVPVREHGAIFVVQTSISSSGSNTLHSVTPTEFDPSSSAGTLGTAALLTATADLNAANVEASAPTQWAQESKPNTTWTQL